MEALALGLPDTYLEAAHADFLLDRGRAAEVLRVLVDRGRADGPGHSEEGHAGVVGSRGEPDR